MDHAPQLPFDYLYSMLLALVPPLWFAAMNPLLDRVLQGKPPVALPTPRAVWAFFIAFNLMLLWFAILRNLL